MLARIDSGLGHLYLVESGLGQGAPSQSAVTSQIENLAVSGGVSISGAAAGAAVSGAAIGASVATAAIGFGVGAVAVAIVAWLNRKGPAQNVATTKIANEIGPLMQQNFDAYMAGPHTTASQAVALDNFDKLWNYLVAACETPQLGNPGKSCVDDRQSGACHWKTSPGGWSNGKYTAPGAAGSGSACWNWFVGMRDPIAQDPTVTDSAASSTVLAALQNGSLDLSTVFSSVAGAGPAVWIALAALALALVI